MLKRIVFMLAALAVFAVILWMVTPTAEFPVTDRPYVDLHAHTAGIGAGDSSAFVGTELAESIKFPFYLRAFEVTAEELERHGDVIVLERMAARVKASRNVGRAVVLAIDGVVDADGRLDRERTQVYVPNEFLIRELPRFPELVFGGSVNPYRPDAIDRLEEIHAAGAVLIKWIPNIMLIDPADERIVPFYQRMAALGIPLLSHAGQERSFGAADDTLGDPRRLALPLSLGVTVIAAHIATTGENGGESNFERILPMFEKHENLYVDISSLTQINKLDYLARAMGVDGLTERMVYGTDWPLQFFPLVSPFWHLDHIGIAKAKGVLAAENPWDRDVRLKQAFGVPESVFQRSAELLGLE